MGSRVSRPTARTSFSVISANASAALRCRSTLSENESVVSADSGSPEKKLVVVRSVGLMGIPCELLADGSKRKTHSQGTAANPQPLLSRSLAKVAHSLATYESWLITTRMNMINRKMEKGVNTARIAATGEVSHCQKCSLQARAARVSSRRARLARAGERG
jgi:hypothetical protein